jgi:hypothetical protein
MPWYARFNQPIKISNRHSLKTLAEARGYILELSATERDRTEWKSAAALLAEAAERGGPHILIARNAVARAIVRKELAPNLIKRSIGRVNVDG